MRVVVENLTGTLFYIQLGNDATVAELKREIEAQEKLPCDRLILVLDTNLGCDPIHDDGGGASLVDYGVRDGSHIYIFFNPLDDHDADDGADGERSSYSFVFTSSSDCYSLSGVADCLPSS
ncbi:hypothetical protein FNV43_RR13408 [Rhamnella rubrinervis]|uniref:Ubiquitin-like domain-containing protein n=1 Tax=Rhamnella rubrinervis TaxID=2594499 RepID=A0A8K0H149_9ROSA|nr:hypothetical protein FNV43_RR13408 [Rhamnella rubrinervis]